MHTAKIVIREVQRDGGFQVRQLFAESIREPRKSPHRHSHRQVLPLHERRADVFGIGIALSDFGYNPRDAWWGVPRFGSVELPVIAKHLGQLREVHIRSKALRDSHGVVVKAVCRELHAVGKALIQVPQESPRIGAHALANAKRGHQLGFCINRNVNPLVTQFGRVSATQVAPFLPDVAPDFVNLQIPGIQFAHSRVHQLGAVFASDNEQPHDRVAIQPRKPFGAANRAAFQKAMQRTFCRFGIRQEQVASEFLVRFAKRGIAGLAAPALNAALTEVAELFAGLVLAFGAGHGVSPLAFCGETRHNELGSEAWVTPRFGLAPPPVSAGSGAFSQLFGFGGGRVIGFHLSFPSGRGRSDHYCFAKSKLSGNLCQFRVASQCAIKRLNPLITYEPTAFLLDRLNFALFFETLQSIVDRNEFLFVFGEVVAPLYEIVPYRGNAKNSGVRKAKNFPHRVCEFDSHRMRSVDAGIRPVISLRSYFQVGREFFAYLFRNGTQAVYYALPLDDFLVDSLALNHKITQFRPSFCKSDLNLVCHGGIMPKTGKFVNEEITTKTGKSGWVLALEKASSHLYKNRLQAKRLRAAIALFKEKIASGEPFPAQLEDHRRERQHVN
jgi:hypothetical protein